MSIIDQFSREDIEALIEENSYLRGYLQGYLAEKKLKDLLLQVSGVTEVHKIPDSKKGKADFKVVYQGVEVLIESKSLQTGSIKDDILNDTWRGTVSIKNTDKRELKIEGEQSIVSTHAIRGQYDILAISTYAVYGDWEFVYIENEYIPPRSMKTPGLLKTAFVVNPETTPCVTPDIVAILDAVLVKKKSINGNGPSKIQDINKD